MTATKGPVLRLMHALDLQRALRAYRVEVRLSRIVTGRLTRDAAPDAAAVAERGLTLLHTWVLEGRGPRTFVVGNGPRVELAGPQDLLPRHLALIAVPRADGVHLRLLALQPDRALSPVAQRDDLESGVLPQPAQGGLMGSHALLASFDGFLLEVRANLLGEARKSAKGPAGDTALLPMGQQLAFSRRAGGRALGTALTSVSGPTGGGHAIPALVSGSGEGIACTGSLALRTRDGCVRAIPTPEDLRRGVLIGRSRRCLLGQGFHENDGLSRLHALVMTIDDVVYAFDLASRYGLRDVTRPSRLLPTVRLDDGVGCLVYGAGHLLFER